MRRLPALVRAVLGRLTLVVGAAGVRARIARGCRVAALVLALTAAALAVLALTGRSAPVAAVVALTLTETVFALVIGGLVGLSPNPEVDDLTGLPSRPVLERAAEQIFAELARSPGPFTLAVIDFDALREVNESLGRAAADRLLTGTAQAWLGVTPPEAILGRAGGDEFAVLHRADARQTAATIAEYRGLSTLPCGFSAGVAQFQPGEAVGALLGRANGALARAKHDHRGQTVVDGDESGGDELVRALQAGEFVVVYQPIVDLPTGSVVGAEALLRWIHPERGSIPPLDFIPLAEKTGFIVELGRWVLLTACQAAAGPDWPRNARLSVNVAGTQLNDLDFVDHVHEILAATGFPPTRLVLEVTESMLEADAPAALEALKALRADGVRIAVDDFGTGYSSLSRLDRLPVDILKIDRAFVSALQPDAAVAPVITAIVALAGAFGMSTIAEGIEEPHQAAALVAHGCDAGQGWLYGRPGSVEALRDLAAEADINRNIDVEAKDPVQA